MIVGWVDGVGWFVEVVFEFTGLFLIVAAEAEAEFSLLGAQHHRLAFHAPYHVEGRPRRAAQGHFQEVFLDAALQSLAQLALDFEVTVRRA